MKIEEALWLHEHREFSLDDFRDLSGLSEAELRELVECGVLAPSDPRAANLTFSADRLVIARSAQRLRRDFELDADAVTLAVTLLERIRDLESELGDLRAKLPGRQR